MKERGRNNDMFDKRINIFTGHYGTGKSEIAVNAAVSIKQERENVVLADMDIVNPFFRSLDAKNILESRGISVLAPLFANTNVDVPALIPEIAAAIKNRNNSVILDVGGDEDGARVLGRYRSDIQDGEYDMFFVINRARPLTGDLEDTLQYMEAIQEASRLKVTKLISNTHYLDQTTPDDVRHGLELSRQVSEKTGIPIAAVSVMEGMEYLAKDPDIPLFVLRKNIRLPF
ncbi:MAG: hypothetical protein GXX04_10385 [Clostridiaceae bacterium]|nr:hypothetical protein [Clostridiaceae bacterium]